MSRHAHIAAASYRATGHGMHACANQAYATKSIRHGGPFASVCIDTVVRVHAPPD